MIRRQIQDTIEDRIFSGKAIIVIGARQVGKSTLFKWCSRIVMNLLLC